MADASQQVRRNPKSAYERADTALLPLLVVAIALIVLLGVVPMIIRASFPGTRFDVNRQLTMRAPAPRLQTDPASDLAAYLSKQNELLDSYGWADREKGIARIPISVAMQRLVQSGIDGFQTRALK